MSLLVLFDRSDAAFYVVKHVPEPDETDTDPDVTISFSIRSDVVYMTEVDIYLNGELVLTEAGFESGWSGTMRRNVFNGWDVSFEHEDFAFGSLNTIIVASTPLGHSVSWSFATREVCYSEYRLAIPPTMREKDPNIEKWLKVWDAVHCFVRRKTVGELVDANLFNTDTIPEFALEVAFEEVGLVYPDFPEVTAERKRRLLRNVNAIHASRYTIQGLQFYISLLTDATVEVTKLNNGFFILWNSEAFGFPTPAMMDSSQTDDDRCTYLVGVRSLDIDITITGYLSDDMKAFLEETIYREIPMADDPIQPRNINIIFVEP